MQCIGIDLLQPCCAKDWHRGAKEKTVGCRVGLTPYTPCRMVGFGCGGGHQADGE